MALHELILDILKAGPRNVRQIVDEVIARTGKNKRIAGAVALACSRLYTKGLLDGNDIASRWDQMTYKLK